MKKSFKRHIGRVLSVVMTISAVMTNFTGLTVSAAGNTIDVWDFGGVQVSDPLYTNHIDTTELDNLTIVGDEASGNKGKFLEPAEVDFGGGLFVNTIKNDRLFYLGADGLRSYGTNAKATAAYSDGYTANGMWYANGTGGDARRFVAIKGVNANDAISVYTGPSNSTDLPVHFSCTSDGSTEPIDTFTVIGGEMSRADFVAPVAGDYKIWFDSAGGKPVVNRVVRYPAVATTGKIDLQGLAVPAGYTISFKNVTTGDVIEGTVTETGYTANLTPGYQFTAIMSGAVGFGFTNDTKTIDVAAADVATGKTADLAVETKQTYKASGKVTGFETGYDLTKLVVNLIPDADSLADAVVATVAEDLSFSATLEPDVNYTVVLDGVNDYEIVSGGTFNYNKDVAQDIVVAPKAVYNVSGSFEGLNGTAVTELSFVNVEDEYSYGAAVVDNGYAIALRDGAYLAVAKADGYSTSTHVVVAGGEATKNLLFVANPYVAPDIAYSADVYVGCPDKTPNFDTVGAAMEAVKVMNPTSEAQRITVHIAPGTYREQISIDTPYLTFVKEGEGDVVLTWYYGIGYKYYSVDTTGYYNVENDFDKYDKHSVSKWGVGTYVKEAAKAFRAEGITFEASFNKYITDAEIIDGVESDGSSIAFTRTLGCDVTTKTATERSTAICIESDDTEFKDCTFIGSQDTLYIGGKVTNDVYFKDCVIEGNTDYIFGSGDAVFDGCELRFCGYSDAANGGYITAGRSNSYPEYNGYLFRSCTITNKEGMLHTGGYYGRPWDQNAAIYFYNTKLENADAITAAGWTSMSGVNPEVANFKEYNTTYAGQAVDVAGRTANTVQPEGSVVDPVTYFGADWTPVYYVAENGTPVYTTAPYFSTGGDVSLPATGDTFTVKYDLGANAEVDASRVDYYTVAADGTETLVKTTSAIENEGIVLTTDMIGSKLKAVVTPILYSGATAEAVTLVTEKEITQGSGSTITERPSGKAVIFLAGDSTVKDYSAGAINNSGANRPEGSWGEFIEYFVDSDKYEVMNYAQGGRSSRTFIDGTSSGNDKYLDKIKADMMAGDYLFIQFGHNDSSADYTDRYVPVGTPDANGVYPSTAPSAEGAGDGSFKWYLQQYVDAAKAVGATPVMVTPVARMYFTDGVIRSHHGANDEYVTVTKQVAEENGILCIDLYAISKALYEEAYAVNGNDTLPSRLFSYGEKTHHSKLGGFALAAIMANEIKADGTLGFAESIVKPASVTASDDKGNVEFMLWSDSTFEGYGKNADGVYDSKVAEEYWTAYINELLNAEVAVEAAYGDANADGEVDASDAAATLQYVLNPAAVEINTTNADVDGKAGLEASDAAQILQKALVSTHTFPVEAA